MYGWWFSWFLRIANVYQCIFTFILLDKEDRGLRHKKKLLDTIYVFFFNNCSRWLKLMTHSKNVSDILAYCAEKNDYVHDRW